MAKKLSKTEGIWLVSMGITLVAGLWVLWSSDMTSSNLIMHIKFIYSLFLALAITISAYYIVFKMEEKNGKK